jgi:hypothetical protein
MAGTLSYRLQVAHIYQRRFDSASFAEALATSHWYIITRRPSTKIIAGSVRIEDQILTADFTTRTTVDHGVTVHAFGSDLRRLGIPSNFQLHADGAYFSMKLDGNPFHGDAWALASLLSGADPDISGQEVLYIGQAFGSGGGRNAWERTQNHKKLQRIYEDHVSSDYEIFVAPLSIERSLWVSDDHIDDTEPGPSLSAYEEMFASSAGVPKKATVDLIEHSLISYFAPYYNEKLIEWRATSPTGAMRKMRSAGFRLLHVHLSGWWGLARFYSAQCPELLRSHFISQDVPPEPRRPVLRGIAAEKLSEWRFGAMLAREGKQIFADMAENTGTVLRVFGEEAPSVRKPPGVKLGTGVDVTSHTTAPVANNAGEHEKIRALIHSRREEQQKAEAPIPCPEQSTYDPMTGSIQIGESKDGEAAIFQLNDPHSGAVSSSLVVGDRGRGKTNHLNIIVLQAIQSGCFYVIPSDPCDRNNFRELWKNVCDDRFIATDNDQTITNLERGRRMIDVRHAARNFSRPSEEVPGVLITIDDADAVLKHDRAARLACEIISDDGAAGIGLLLVISDLSELENDGELMSHLVTCSNISAFMPNGHWVIKDLKARYGQPRSSTLRDETISFVMHHGPQNTTLGLVMAATGNDATASDAKGWCRDLLREHGVTTLLDWNTVDDDPRSWWTVDPLMLGRWYLRQHSDGWIIIRVLTNWPCTSGPDALNWANEFIQARFTTQLTSWLKGPDTGKEGVLAYYADVRGDLTPKDHSELTKKFLLSRY